MSSAGPSSIDRSLKLTPIGEGRYRIGPEQPLLNFNAAFGGWGLAALLTGIQKEKGDTAPLAAINAVFLKAIPPEELEVRTALLREGRQASFWRAELVSVSKGTVRLTGDFIFSALKQKDIEAKRSFPDVQSFAEAPLLPSKPGPLWLQEFEQRIGAGQPFSAQHRPHSAFWFGDPSRRAWDETGIALVSDTPMPRTFFVDPVPRFGATVAYSLYITANLAGLGDQSRKPLLIEADSDSVGNGRFSQSAYIWSSDRTLLAISNQMALY